MADYYVDSVIGHDSGSGSLNDPWLTITRAVAAPGTSSVIHLQPGTYQATNLTLAASITLSALAPGVIVEPASGHSAWTQINVKASSFVMWHAAASNLPAGKRITQATWQDSSGLRHRIPVWNPVAPLDTPDKWAATILAVANSHTRWGLWSNATDLYLIPPSDWVDPNTVRIVTGYAPAFLVNGPDITLDGLDLPAHQSGVRLDSLAARAHLVNLHTDCCGSGIAIFANPNPIVYGHDHLIEKCTLADNASSVRDGDSIPAMGQGISWNLIKVAGFNIGSTATPILVNKALTDSETVGFYTNGGSLNTVVQDCTFDGTFDGASHYAEDNRYDNRCDTGLIIRRCEFRNHADDALDRSRYQNGVTVEDCTFRNTGTILSPAPLWGSVTLRNCTGSMIGDQVRVPDGRGSRPPGSVVKCGSVDLSRPQGTARIESSIFWSNNPTTQGVSQDGGTGVRGPKLETVNTTMRVGFIVVNWPYPAADFLDSGNTWSTSSSRPLKTALPIVLTPAATVDARYFDPAGGDFSDMDEVTTLQAQVAELQAQVTTLQGQLATSETKAQSLAAVVAAWQTAQANLLAITTT